MSSALEYRRAPQSSASVKPVSFGDGILFSGYAVQWGQESDDLGGFVEMFLRGAFTKALASPRNLVFVVDHAKEIGKTLGDTSSGRLKVWEDDKGLAFQCRAIPNQGARDAALAAENLGVGVSFAFICDRQAFSTKFNGTRLRTISAVSALDDISIVVDAAYKSSVVRVGLPPAPSVDLLRRRLDLAQAEMQFI